MQDYIEAYNNALKDLYTALNSRSPTCWKTVFFELLLFSRASSIGRRFDSSTSPK